MHLRGKTRQKVWGWFLRRAQVSQYPALPGLVSFFSHFKALHRNAAVDTTEQQIYVSVDCHFSYNTIMSCLTLIYVYCWTMYHMFLTYKRLQLMYMCYSSPKNQWNVTVHIRSCYLYLSSLVCSFLDSQMSSQNGVNNSCLYIYSPSFSLSVPSLSVFFLFIPLHSYTLLFRRVVYLHFISHSRENKRQLFSPCHCGFFWFVYLLFFFTGSVLNYFFKD